MRLVAALVLSGVFVFAGPASAAVITFDVLASTTTQTLGAYSEDGFTFTSNFVTFISPGSSAPNYTGSPALANYFVSGTTTLAQGGAPFSLAAIDLSELFNEQTYNPIPVTFTAAIFGGGTATQTFNLDLVFGNQTFLFNPTFSSITSVSWVQSFDAHQFDNVVVNAVPEPASLLLLGTGIAGLTATVRRRRRRQAQ